MDLTAVRDLVREAVALAADGARVAALLIPVEVHRRSVGLAAAVARARAVGRTQPRRDHAARRRLRRVIAAVDRRFPGGGNCYRRSLLELALDRGAAAETMFAGLMVRGGPLSGHAWLESHERSENEDGQDRRKYDAVMEL